MRPHNRERDEEIRRRLDAGEAAAIGADLGLGRSGVYAASQRALARARGQAAARLVPKLDPMEVSEDRDAAKKGGGRIELDAIARAEIAAAKAEMPTTQLYRGGW
jgi:hypothetical protein